ncbi:hypothetical protein ACS0TY_005648 [Phlomoides rotata]
MSNPLRQRPSSNQASTPDADNVGPSPVPPRRSTLSQVLESSGNLANLLPTGTVLAFQLLTPIFTSNGSCDAATRPMAVALLAVLALSCLLASLTDSIKGPDGRVHYGLVTWRGMWMLDDVADDVSKYRLAGIDVIHAGLSLVVFVSVAMRDKNVVRCLYPEAEAHGKALNILPIGIGIVCSFLFVRFPTTRHGIGYPVARGR